MVHQELSNSFIGPDVDVKSQEGDVEQGGEHVAIDRKIIWGLFCVYAAIGTVNGFFATYLQQPTICQYVFGPMGDGPNDHTTLAQCNAAASVFQMSWNFKLFFGFFLDVFPFFGSRRKGWLLFGWTGGLIMLAVNAILVTHFVETHQFESYLYLMMTMCIFYTFSDVAGDGMIIEVSKYEKPHEKGYTLTTCQMIRFTMMMVSTGLGTLFMSGKDYQPPGPTKGDLILPFEISFAGMHWLLLGVAMPFYIGMWVWLKDPPPTAMHKKGCAGMKEATGRVWIAMKSFAVLMLLINCYGINGVAAMVNPANANIQSICGPSNIQLGIGAFIGNLFFVIGVWIFRTVFMTKNWRFTLFMTQALTALGNFAALMAVYDTWGISRNGWFYMVQNSLPLIIQGMGQVVASLAVVEVSPPGLEATVYELLISASNGAISLAVALQTVFGNVFQLSSINGETFPLNEAVYEERMMHSTVFCLCVNIGAAAIFMWCLPRGPAQCKDWSGRKWWHKDWVALLNVVVFAVPFIWANYSVLMDVSGS